MRIKTILLLCFVALTMSAQKRVAILGDSYSTYQGFITPATNEPWYFEPWIDERTDVNDVTQTWWHQVVTRGHFRLETNNSYSGATICYTGYNGDDYSARSFITRADNLGSPDLILVFGGTNDAWANSPIGEYKYKDWKREDLYAFRPAMCYLAHYLKERYPGVDIRFIINTELKDEVTQGIKDVCDHYGMRYIELHDIAKQMGHPNAAGMKAIADQVLAHLYPQHAGKHQMSPHQMMQRHAGPQQRMPMHRGATPCSAMHGNGCMMDKACEMADGGCPMDNEQHCKGDCKDCKKTKKDKKAKEEKPCQENCPHHKK